MKIKVIETGKIEELKAHSKNGVDWTADLILNTGDNTLLWNPESEEYEMHQCDFDWWEEYINHDYKTQEEIKELAEKLKVNISKIEECVSENKGSDFDWHRAEAVESMDDFRKEYHREIANEIIEQTENAGINIYDDTDEYATVEQVQKWLDATENGGIANEISEIIYDIIIYSSR